MLLKFNNNGSDCLELTWRGRKEILYQTHCLEWLVDDDDNEKQTGFNWL